MNGRPRIGQVPIELILGADETHGKLITITMSYICPSMCLSLLTQQTFKKI